MEEKKRGLEGSGRGINPVSFTSDAFKHKIILKDDNGSGGGEGNPNPEVDPDLLTYYDP